MRRIICQKCGFANRIYAVTCEQCRENLYEQETVSPPCDDPPPVVGNGHEDKEIPEDAEIIDSEVRPKVIIMRWECPNCGKKSLVYDEETGMFWCCLSEEKCGAKYALGRVYDEQLVS